MNKIKSNCLVYMTYFSLLSIVVNDNICMNVKTATDYVSYFSEPCEDEATMDANTNLMMIDTDDTSPQNPVQAALAGSESRFVANSERDVVRLAIFMRGDAIINSLTVTTRNVRYIRMLFFMGDSLSEELVRSLFSNELRREKTCQWGFLPGPTQNWAVWLQKSVRGLKCLFKEVKGWHYLCSKTAQLINTFVLQMQKSDSLMMRLK